MNVFLTWCENNRLSKAGSSKVKNMRASIIKGSGIFIYAIFFILFASSARSFVNHQPAEIVLGQADMTSNGTNNSGLSARSLSNPWSVCSDGTHLFVADTGNHRVLIFNHIPTSNYAVADVVLGQPDMTSNSGNNGGLSARSLFGPQSVCSDGTRLFVADTHNNRILIFNSIPTFNHAPADVVIGQPDMTSNDENNGGVSGVSLYLPFGVCSDGTLLYVADQHNNRVLIYNLYNYTHAYANVVLGQPDMMSNAFNNGGLSAVSLAGPTGVYSDGTHLFVADFSNNRVLIYNSIPTVYHAPADVVIGQPNMTSGANNYLNANSLNYPSGIFSDGTRLFVADYFNNRILIYNSIPTSNHAPADAVIGQPDMTSSDKNNGGLGASSLCEPYSVYSDGTRLFVADTFNNRILIYAYPSHLAGISPTYGLSGKTIQVIGPGFGDETMAKLTRPGSTDIISNNAVVYCPGSYKYTFNLTQAAPNCYDITINIPSRTLKQAFTVLAPQQIPFVWKITDLGQAGTQTSISNDCGLAIGDPDRDNQQELYVANQDERLYEFTHSGQTWNFTALTASLGKFFGPVLLADGNGDQYWEAYGGSISNNHLFQFSNASGWQTTDMGPGYTGTSIITALTKADVYHDGVMRIYAAATDSASHFGISQFDYNGSTWSSTDIPGSPANQSNALAAGDGKNDGATELYSANSDGSVYQYTYSGTAWQASVVGTGTDVMYGIALGDGENNGQQQVYGANKNGKIYQFSWNGNSWDGQSIGNAGAGAMYAVAVSDGDNDGFNEVFASCGDGHIYMYKKSGGWTTTDFGDAKTPLYALAVGDADNDHHFEVYALGQNNHVFQFAPAAVPTLTPTPLPTSTPTPTATPTITPIAGFSGKLLDKHYTYFAPNPVRGDHFKFVVHVPRECNLECKLYTTTHDYVLKFNLHCTGPGKYEHQEYVGNLANGVYLLLVKAESPDGTKERLVKKMGLIK